MRTLAQFLNEYGETHRNPLNQTIHTICVPIIVLCTLGILWSVPIGRWLGWTGPAGAWVNLATLALPLALWFYWRLSTRVFLAMFAFLIACLTLVALADRAGLPVLWISLAIWVAAWIGQFVGHKIEGAKPSFFDDLVFLLIGPVFVLAKLAPAVALRRT